MDEELYNVLSRIAVALELIAEKPVPGIVLEVSDRMTENEAMEAMK
jgi:hypothetical protein